MPLTSVTKDAARLTLTVVGDYPVPQQRLWQAFADPRQLERFWGPPTWPATRSRPAISVPVIPRPRQNVPGDNAAKW